MVGNIVILTGAGISAESGIKTFRDTGGLWEEHPVEEVATPEGFTRNPDLVHRFYNLRRAALHTVEPNAAHIALATLETEMENHGGNLMIVTQNVDDLHERGGSKNILHMHGQLLSLLCQYCQKRWTFQGETSTDMPCPNCQQSGGPRPDIVWFGEMPYGMHTIEKALKQCDLFVSIGTSGAVYPAAGFVHMARSLGAKTLELNLEASEGSSTFHDSRLGKASTLVPAWVDEIVAGLKV